MVKRSVGLEQSQTEEAMDKTGHNTNIERAVFPLRILQGTCVCESCAHIPLNSTHVAMCTDTHVHTLDPVHTKNE